MSFWQTLANIGLNLGQGYYQGLADRNRMQYGLRREQYDLGRQREQDARSRALFEQNTALHNARMAEITRGIEREQRSDLARQQTIDLYKTIAQGGGDRQELSLPPNLQQFNAQMGVTPNAPVGPMGPTLPARTGPMGMMEGFNTILGSGYQPEAQMSALNMLMNLTGAGRDEWRFSREQRTADEQDRLMNATGLELGLASDHPLAKVPYKYWDPTIRADDFWYRQLSRPDPATAKAAADATNEAIPGRLQYEADTRRPVADVQAGFAYDRTRADWLNKPASAFPTLAPYMPKGMENMPFGVAGEMLPAMSNAVRAGYGMIPAGESGQGYSGLNVRPEDKGTPRGLLPDVAAAGAAANAATAANRSGDTVETVFARNAPGIKAAYKGQKDIPAAYIQRYIDFAEKGMADGRLQWTPDDLNRYKQMLLTLKPDVTIAYGGQSFQVPYGSEQHMQYAAGEEAFRRQKSLAGMRAAGSSEQMVTIRGGGPNGEDIQVPADDYWRGTRTGKDGSNAAFDQAEYKRLKDMTLPGSNFEGIEVGKDTNGQPITLQHYVDMVTNQTGRGTEAARYAREILKVALQKAAQSDMSMSGIPQWVLNEYLRRAAEITVRKGYKPPNQQVKVDFWSR